MKRTAAILLSLAVAFPALASIAPRFDTTIDASAALTKHSLRMAQAASQDFGFDFTNLQADLSTNDTVRWYYTEPDFEWQVVVTGTVEDVDTVLVSVDPAHSNTNTADAGSFPWRLEVQSVAGVILATGCGSLTIPESPISAGQPALITTTNINTADYSVSGQWPSSSIPWEEMPPVTNTVDAVARAGVANNAVDITTLDSDKVDKAGDTGLTNDLEWDASASFDGGRIGQSGIFASFGGGTKSLFAVNDTAAGLAYTEDDGFVADGNGAFMAGYSLRFADSLLSGAPHTTVNSNGVWTYTKPISGVDAVAATDLVTKQQLDAAAGGGGGYRKLIGSDEFAPTAAGAPDTVYTNSIPAIQPDDGNNETLVTEYRQVYAGETRYTVEAYWYADTIGDYVWSVMGNAHTTTITSTSIAAPTFDSWTFTEAVPATGMQDISVTYSGADAGTTAGNVITTWFSLKVAP